MPRSVTGLAWIFNLIQTFHQTRSDSAHIADSKDESRRDMSAVYKLQGGRDLSGGLKVESCHSSATALGCPGAFSLTSATPLSPILYRYVI